MVRRKILKWAAPLVTLATLTLIFCWSVTSRDPDIQWLGPKSKGIRHWLACLNAPVDIAGVRRSMTLEESLGLLYERCDKGKIELPVLVDSLAFKKEGFQGEPSQIQIELSTMDQRLSAGQFLKAVIAQFPSQNGTILLRSPTGGIGGHIEITTKNQVSRLRAAYDSAYRVTSLDYVWQRSCEALGGECHQPEASMNLP
jgi:hypothetical protein